MRRSRTRKKWNGSKKNVILAKSFCNILHSIGHHLKVYSEPDDVKQLILTVHTHIITYMYICTIISFSQPFGCTVIPLNRERIGLVLPNNLACWL